MGITFAIFRSCGTIPITNDLFIMRVMACKMLEILSTDSFGFKLWVAKITSDGVIGSRNMLCILCLGIYSVKCLLGHVMIGLNDY